MLLLVDCSLPSRLLVLILQGGVRVTLQTAAKLSVYLFDEIKCVILRIKMHFEQRVSKGENALKQREMKALLE